MCVQLKTDFLAATPFKFMDYYDSKTYIERMFNMRLFQVRIEHVFLMCQCLLWFSCISGFVINNAVGFIAFCHVGTL